jgi:hypothetical protein
MQAAGYKQDYIENEYAEFWIEDGIILEIFKPSVEIINLDIAVKMVYDRLKVSNNRTMPLYVDLNKAREMDSAARTYFSKGDSLKYVSACGVHMHNYIHWLGAKLFLAVYSQQVKLEVFRTKGKAIEWLKNYKTQTLN